MNPSRTLRLVAVPASLLALAAPGLGSAQEPNPNVSVVDRPRPDFDALGIRAGSFLVFPEITVAEEFNDNVFAEEDDEDSDFITIIAPVIDVRSTFSRNSLGFTLGSEIGRYLDETDENYEDVFLNGDATLDVTSRSRIDFDAEVGRFHEARDDPEDVAAEEITEFLRFGGGVRFSQAFNRINVAATGRVLREDFDDAGTINNDDRDEVTYDALLRGGYLISPRVNAFVEGRYTIESRDDDVDDAGFDRDSNGYEARLGTAVDFTGLLFGEAFVGYREEQFDDERLDDVNGFSFGVDLTYNITRLTTLQLSGEGDIESTTIAGANGNFNRQIELSVDHELLRNLIVSGLIGFEQDDFESLDRVDDRINVGAGVTYLINRNFAVEGDYEFTDRSSDDPTVEFTRNVVRVGLTAKL